jgi:two-component system chemotaxis family response regulator WspR
MLTPKQDQPSLRPSDERGVMVLLVDDQVMIGEVVRRALAGQEDINFHYCGDATEALAVAQQIEPTVILQDLVMPGVDGLDLVRGYRANPQTRDIPIIVLSSRDEAEMKSDAFAAGANDYLVKLPDNIELVARVRYHSKSYLTMLQRDDAYRALRESQQQLVQINLELQRLNNVDGLTGLANKRCVLEFMKTEWSRAVREHSTLSVLMIDVDNFKSFNDTQGHLAGDDALKRIAERIDLGMRRSTDIAARFGGEEFIVLLPATDPDGAGMIAEKLRTAIADLNIPHSGSKTGHVTASIGGACLVPEHGSDYAHLIEAADQALYAAKRGGRDRVVMSTTDTSIADSSAT